MRLLFLLFLLLLSTQAMSDPWGKDADLAYRPKTPAAAAPIPTPLFGKFGEVAINFHQTVVSDCDGPRSHFIPSSSQYTLDAMRKYGFFCGYQMGCDRLMRENSEEWVYPKTKNSAGQIMKWDPVR